MTASDPLPAHAPDPKLAAHAFAAAPVWLWAADGTRVLWANAAGAAAFGEPAPHSLTQRRFDAGHPASREISRLATSLPYNGVAQLSRLRGIASGVGRALTCACSRIRLPGEPAGVLVVAEPIKPALSLAERVRRVLGGAPMAIAFAADGTMLHVGDALQSHLPAGVSPDALGIAALADEAKASGRATGNSKLGAVTVERFSAGDTAVILATFDSVPAETIADVAPAETITDAAPPADDEQENEEPAPPPSGSLDVEFQAAEESEVPILNAPEPPPEFEPPDDEQAQTGPAELEPEIAHPVAAHDVPAASTEAPSQPDAAITAQVPPPEPPNAPAAEPAETTAAPSEPNTLALLAEAEARLVERRHPLRFVWTIDPQGAFTIESDDFALLAGAPTAAALGKTWPELAQALALDPEGRVMRAIASHDTWSGITVDWPAEAGTARLPVLMSGLPVLGRERSFGGYRGFGVCRDVAPIATVIAARRASLLADPSAVSAAPTDEVPAVASASGPVDPDVDTETEPTLPATDSESVDADRETSPPEAPRPPVRDIRTQLTVVPAAKNVVPLRTGVPPEKRPALTPVERSAFHEIARALGARLEGEGAPAGETAGSESEGSAPSADEPAGDPGFPVSDHTDAPAQPALPQEAQPAPAVLEQAILDRLPVAVLVFRGDDLQLANRTLLEWTGFESLEALATAGGIDVLFAADPGAGGRAEPDGASHALLLRSRSGSTLPVDARLFTLASVSPPSMLLTLAPAATETTRKREDRPSPVREQPAPDPTAGELKSILDTATDGVIVVDAEGKIRSVNRSAEALFGYEAQELEQQSFTELFAPESQRSAADYLDGLTRSGVASLLNDGREVIGRVRQGGLIPLFMTMGRLSEAPPKFCAVFRDITQWKRAEEELTNAKREAERASSAKSDFLAKISHEIRTPLNAIIGFSEVMMEERFGPIGNDRYRGYARDIHTSGEHMISLLNDLLDLSKIEAGKLELTFTRVDLNEVMHQCVALMQPQANRERIIIRTALSPTLPPVVADVRSVRQIILNLLSNSIKFTGAGGQVIVSTALTDNGEAVLRVRDTGVGMSEKDIATALEPFRQLPTASRLKAAGTGLGLPLTKALAEANRAAFHIQSAPNSGTLVEIVFPANRVLAE